MSKCYLVTRHPGTIEWAANAGLRGEALAIEDFDPAIVDAGDIVMGTLPMHLAARVSERGGLYWHLSIDVPHAWRGRELTSAQMNEFGARLESYHVRAQGRRWPPGPAVPDAATGGIHLCIASGQTLPNLLPLLALAWDRLVVFTTPRMAPAARKIESIVASRRPGSSCEIVAMPDDAEWATLSAFAEKQAARFESSAALDVNLTGGTKLMALAFHLAFRDRARLIYCSTENERLEFVGAQAGVSMPLAPDLLNVETYLRAQGFDIASKLEWRGRDVFLQMRRREALTASLVLHWEKLATLSLKPACNFWLAPGLSQSAASEPRGMTSLIGLLHLAASQALPKYRRDGKTARRFRPKVDISNPGDGATWGPLLQALHEHDIISLPRRVTADDGMPLLCFEFHDECAAAYIAGGYLEEYVLLCLRSLGLPIDQYAANVRIGLLARSEGASAELNELDAVAVWRNRMVVVECKAGVQVTSDLGQDIVNKLDNLKDNVGGLMGQACLVTQRRLDEGRHADVFDRARLNGIEVLHGAEAMRTLATTLGDRLHCDVEQPWPGPTVPLLAF